VSGLAVRGALYEGVTMAMLAPENGAYNMPSVLPTTVVLHPDVMVERLKQQQVTILGQRY